MPEEAKISVVVPVYKVENYLKRCVDSILSQSFDCFDLILVDDGSPDRCGDICEDYKKTDKRITVIHQENGGLSVARNTGIAWALENSASEWITFIDSDDWIHPLYLELLYGAVSKTGNSVAIGSYETTDKIIPFENYEGYRIQSVKTTDFYLENMLTATVAWGKLYRKSDFEEIRYPKGKIHEDEHTTYRLLFKYEKIAFVDCPIYFYFQNMQSIMRSNWNPAHLAEIEGKKKQLEFFLENGYEDVAKIAAENYLNCIYRNINHARENKENQQKFEKPLMEQWRKEYQKYGKLTDINMKTASWLICEMFPIRTLPYRVIRKIKK